MVAIISGLLAMLDTRKSQAPSGFASVFVAPAELRGSGFDIWAEASCATELAYREPASMNQAVRVAVVVTLVVAATLGVAGVFG
jgi:hypothetical protein